jgi:predicted alpha/beta-hydrolase family hydrolase
MPPPEGTGKGNPRALVEPAARFEEVEITVPEDVTGIGTVRGVLGIPEWWPTGSRVGVVLAHGRSSNLDDPVVTAVHRGLTEKGFLSLRFNFPFAEQKKKRPDKDAVLDRVLLDAVQLLGRDATSAPAHLFLGGSGIGGKSAARVAMARLRVEGLFFMGYPLHAADKPAQLDAELLYRIISPSLFLQGDRDRYCDLDVLRQTLTRVGAPKTLQVVAEADSQFKVLKKSGRTPEEIHAEMLAGMEQWINRVLEA